MLSSRNHWKCTSPEENALPGRPKWHGKCNKKHQKHEKRMLTMKTIRKQWTDFWILLFRKYTFPKENEHFCKTNKKARGEHIENTWKKHEKMMKNMTKWKKSHVNFLGALLKQKHSFYWWNFTTTWPRALKKTPKNTPKNIKKHEKWWTKMNILVNAPFQKIHVFPKKKAFL